MRIPRSMAVLLIGAVGLLVAGVIVAIASSHRPATTFPVGSPEATYLRLLQNGQVDEAYTMTAFTQPAITREDYHQRFDSWSAQPHRVTLVRSSVAGNLATVTVETSTFGPGLFGADDRTVQQTLTLVRREANWLITGPDYLNS